MIVAARQQDLDVDPAADGVQEDSRETLGWKKVRVRDADFRSGGSEDTFENPTQAAVRAHLRDHTHGYVTRR